MRKNSKKTAAAAATAVVLLSGAGVAYAFWSAGGSGTGTATTSTNVPITAVQTSVVSGLQPGGAAQTLSGNFTNGNTSPVYVSSVTASISSVTINGEVAVGCDATDYTIANAAMTVGAEVPAGTAKGAWTGATITFNNKATNQDACKGATVNLAYAIS
jgi:ABC-type spermidine/putrescine transport system permease subunit II